MINKLKSNKLMSALLIIMCIIILIKPKTYLNSSLNAISVWAFNILPLMFPFFVLTRIITDLNPPKQNPFDKYFRHVYHTPDGSFLTFLLSIMAGYPMGAKLICSMFKNGQTTKSDAKKMLAFCSVSGPVFIIGTVGVIFLQSYKAGLIILISNVFSALLNGLIYRGKSTFSLNKKITLNPKQKPLSDYISDALNSVLMIAGYLILCFLIIDILINLGIVRALSYCICRVFSVVNQQDIVSSIICGSIEMTRGISMISKTHTSIAVKTIISSSLISFGGFSVILQSLGFLKELDIRIKHMLIQKFTQTILCLALTILLCLVFF